jgi:hypothetical protein
LLAFSVFMLLIAENIPATSETVPLIGMNNFFAKYSDLFIEIINLN